MSDEPSFDFLPWEELPVGVRRNRKKMYNYLVGVLNGGEPGPTPPGPTGTGTVTVTCQDESEALLEYVSVYLTTQADWDFSFDTLDIDQIVGLGVTESDGICALLHNEDPNIPFGQYYLYGIDGNETLTYYGTLTVDGDEEITITLTIE